MSAADRTLRFFDPDTGEELFTREIIYLDPVKHDQAKAKKSCRPQTGGKGHMSQVRKAARAARDAAEAATDAERAARRVALAMGGELLYVAHKAAAEAENAAHAACAAAEAALECRPTRKRIKK